MLIKIENGKLTTTVYSKPTDGHLYLHNDSCHPKNSKLAIQRNVALRLRKICSSENEFQNKRKEYKASLVSRGHNPNDATQNFENISCKNARTKCRPAQATKSKHRFFT